MLEVDLYCLPLTNHRSSLNSSLFFWCCFQSGNCAIWQLKTSPVRRLLQFEAASWKTCGSIETCACESLVLREILGGREEGCPENVVKSSDKMSDPPRKQHMAWNCKMLGDTATYSFLTEPGLQGTDNSSFMTCSSANLSCFKSVPASVRKKKRKMTRNKLKAWDALWQLCVVANYSGISYCWVSFYVPHWATFILWSTAGLVESFSSSVCITVQLSF